MAEATSRAGNVRTTIRLSGSDVTRRSLHSLRRKSLRAAAGSLSPVCAYLEANLHDPMIQPRRVAAALQMSVRQLHRLFSQAGISMGAWVRRERLRRCAADMRDRSRGNSTLTEMAFAWGFNDSAHFSRCFKAHYGVTPRSYRAAFTSLRRLPARCGKQSGAECRDVGSARSRPDGRINAAVPTLFSPKTPFATRARRSLQACLGSGFHARCAETPGGDGPTSAWWLPQALRLLTARFPNDMRSENTPYAVSLGPSRDQ